MKKLMIGLVIACVAVCAKASTYEWGAAGLYAVEPGTSDKYLSTGTAYLFDTATISQQAALDALKSTTIAALFASSGVKDATSSKSVDTIEIGGDWGTGLDVSGKFEYDASCTLFAIVTSSKVPDAYLFTPEIPVEGSATAGDTVTIDTGWAEHSSSAINTTGVYSGDGWYGAAVPEPTSGLLLLLGVAGLALRRRRA